MKIETVKALRLSWEMVARIIEYELFKILGRNMVCRAQMDDDTYWAITFLEERLSISDLYTVFEITKATAEQRAESLPPESERTTSVNCLSMEISELLLSRYLRYRWEQAHLESTSLWLLGEKKEAHHEA